jgi:antitoxin FitA
LSTDRAASLRRAPAPGTIDAMTATLEQQQPSSATSALQRYNSAMATIQIREIPDEAYETLRRLAKAEGKSLQSYMRDHVVEMARKANKAAKFAAYEQILAKYPPTNLSTQSILDAIDEGRSERSGR